MPIISDQHGKIFIHALNLNQIKSNHILFYQCSKTTKTGCLCNPTPKWSTPLFKKWDSRQTNSASKKCYLHKNGHCKWSANQCSAFCSCMRLLLFKPNTKTNRLTIFILSKYQPIYSLWNNMHKMHVALLDYFTSC